MRRSTLFAIIFIAILGVIGYIWYGYWQTPVAGTEESVTEDDFTRTLAQVARLKNLNLDTSLFRERAFTDLESPQIPPEPDITPGRPNPFAAFK